MLFHRLYWIYLFKKGALNKPLTGREKQLDGAAKCVVHGDVVNATFLLNTQYLEPSSKELFAQDLYLNDMRGRIFFIINNHSRENCTWEEKVAHQQLTYQLHRQILAYRRFCINETRQDVWEESGL